MKNQSAKLFLLLTCCCSYKSFSQVPGNISIKKHYDNIYNSPHHTPVSRESGTTGSDAVLTIITPADYSIFNAGSDISLQSTITNASDSLVKIAFYNNGNKFYDDTLPFFGYTRVDAEPGDYIVTAKVFFKTGDSVESNAVHITVTGCNGSGNISAEGYTNITGSQISDLVRSPKFPYSPDVSTTLNKFEYGPNYGNNYGARIRGYICAPVTGDYTFYIAGDDQDGLWLSTDENPGNKVLIAYNEFYVSPRAWYTYPSQKSAPIKLIKGVRYYIESLHKEYLEPDYLAVAWQIPGGAFESPIPGSRLSPMSSSFPAIASADFASQMSIANNDKGVLKVSATPNPSSDHFTITTHSRENKSLNIIISDIAGKVIERKTNLAVNTSFQIGNRLPKGIYFVEIMQGGRTERLKLIKQ